jgi:hypothetical protein
MLLNPQTRWRYQRFATRLDDVFDLAELAVED